MSRPNNESMLGILKRYTDMPIEPITDWEALKGRAWATRTAESREVLRADSERHKATRSREKS